MNDTKTDHPSSRGRRSPPELFTHYLTLALALWLVCMAESVQGGVFNVTGPDHSMTMGQFLDACNTVVSGDSTFTWVDDQFLVDRDVAYWSELPLWLPESSPWRLDISRAIQSGLELRPISQTIADIRGAWCQSLRLACRIHVVKRFHGAGWSQSREGSGFTEGMEPAFGLIQR